MLTTNIMATIMQKKKKFFCSLVKIRVYQNQLMSVLKTNLLVIRFGSRLNQANEVKRSECEDLCVSFVTWSNFAVYDAN